MVRKGRVKTPSKVLLPPPPPAAAGRLKKAWEVEDSRGTPVWREEGMVSQDHGRSLVDSGTRVAREQMSCRWRIVPHQM